jgi:23S rRNA (cytosine1962-C5)-methyltransferase
MTVPTAAYELLDFGDGRKLERFGAFVVERPCPTAMGVPIVHPDLWHDAVGRFRQGKLGQPTWEADTNFPWAAADWQYQQRKPFRLEIILEPLPSGHVGVFPEQAESWAWVHEQLQYAHKPVRVLNLFAYTGASTIAAAAAGAEVTHVDAARRTVERASQNARASGLGAARIRWIVDDAVKFCAREARRGNRYDAVILDPPTYGHGAKGEAWRIERDLPRLLELCAELTSARPKFVLLTCHTTGLRAARLSRYLGDAFRSVNPEELEQGKILLCTSGGRALPAGIWARWTAPSVHTP